MKRIFSLVKNRRSICGFYVFLQIAALTLVASFAYAVNTDYDLPQGTGGGATAKLRVVEGINSQVKRLYFYYINKNGEEVFHGIMVEFSLAGVKTETLYRHGEIVESRTGVTHRLPKEGLDKIKK